MTSHRPDYKKIRIIRYLKFIYHFGLIHGTKSYFIGHFLTGEHRHYIPEIATSVIARSQTSDIDVLEQIFIRQEYKSNIYNENPTMNIVDGGANIGYATIYFAHKFPQAKFLCIEPDLENYKILQKNTASLNNITTINGALWSKQATLQISNPDDTSWAFQIAEVDKNLEDGYIKAVTLKEVLKWANRTIDILKLDIEGAEYSLFTGPDANGWCKSSEVIFIELHDGNCPGASYAFYKSLISCGLFQQQIKGEYIIIDRRSS